jgi:Inner membrane protein YgaP-like, transmembrane domain
MQQNVGTLDKAARAVLSMVLFSTAWKRRDKLGILAAYTAGMLASSVSSGFCPLYKALKVNTVGKPI